MYPPTTRSATMRLTPKQEGFALAYCRLMNASDAYREAYHAGNMNAKTINEAASRLLKNGKVSARVAELRTPAMAAARLEIEEILRQLASVLRSDPRRFYRPDGSLKPPREWDDGMAAAVSSIEVVEVRGAKGKVVGYTGKIKFWSKIDAIDKAMRHAGLFEKDNRPRQENLAIQINLVGAPAPVEVQAKRVP